MTLPNPQTLEVPLPAWKLLLCLVTGTQVKLTNGCHQIRGIWKTKSTLVPIKPFHGGETNRLAYLSFGSIHSLCSHSHLRAETSEFIVGEFNTHFELNGPLRSIRLNLDIRCHPECICGWRRALQMDHSVLPWGYFPGIPDRWLPSGPCLDTSKVAAPAAGLADSPPAALLDSSRCGKPTKRLELCQARAVLTEAPPSGSKAASLQLQPSSPGYAREPPNAETPGISRAAIRPAVLSFQLWTLDRHRARAADPRLGPQRPRECARRGRGWPLGGRGRGCPHLGSRAQGGQRTFRKADPPTAGSPRRRASRPWGPQWRRATVPREPPRTPGAQAAA